METKDTLSSCSNSEAKQMRQIQDKEKQSCMVYFQQFHSHLKRLSQKDLNGTRIESGFKRAFATLFCQDIESFTGTMFPNVEQLEKQLDKEDFQDIGSMVAFNVLETQIQMFITSQIYLTDEYVAMTRNYFQQYTKLAILEFPGTLIQHMASVKKSIDERAQLKREYDSWLNERQMQTTEEKVDMSKALDACLVDTESSGTYSKEQDTSSRSGDDGHYDTDIRPIYDEEPMVEGFKEFSTDEQAMTFDHNSSELEIHDHSNEPSSSKLVLKVVPSANNVEVNIFTLNVLSALRRFGNENKQAWYSIYNIKEETGGYCNRTQDIVMLDLEDSTVTYTKVSSLFEDLSDIGSPRAGVFGYDGLPMHPPSPDYVTGPEHPPSLDYVLGLKHPPSYAYVPYVSKPTYPEFMPHEDDEDDEDLDDYPTNRDDDDDEEESSGDDADDEEEDEDEDDEEEEKENLALTDFVPPLTYRTTARMSVRAQTSIPLSFNIEITRLLAMPTLPPSPLTLYSSPLPQIPSPPLPASPTHPLGYRAAMIRVDVPEVTLPPRKRLCIAIRPKFKVGECSSVPTARPIGCFIADYGFVGTLDAEIRRDPDREIVTRLLMSGRILIRLQRRYPRLMWQNAQDDRLLMIGQLNSLCKDRRSHARTARFMETEARASREAWSKSIDANDTARSELLVCYDDDDDEERSNSLKYNIISGLPPCAAITPNEPVDSLSMGDEHLNTISATKSDEFIKSSVENLVPNPSESEGESECDVPACFTTFSNILFAAEYDFYSIDDQSFSDEDLLKEIYSNPLFDEEIIPMKIDPHPFNAESDLIESMLNHDSLIIISSKIDSLFDEFTDELTLLKSISLGIDETDCHPEEETHFTKRLFDSLMEEIDLSFTPDYPMPSGIEDDDYDSERDILISEDLISNYSLSLPENKSYHFDIPSSSRPHAKPPDGNTGILNIKMIGFPAQSVRSSYANALDLPYLNVLNTRTSQSRQHESAIASLMFFGFTVLTRVIFCTSVFRILWLIEGVVSCCLELSIGEEDPLTLEHAVPIASAQKNKGSFEAESIVRVASTRVQFRRLTMPFCSGVRVRTEITSA
nr:hypothetical protein [Tanacetum cinerariifolium]